MITEQEFLARRGDRAMRLGFGGSCPTDEVGLVVQSAALRYSAAHPAVVAAANLLARWVPNLSVHLPVGLETRTGSLATAVEAAVRTANPVSGDSMAGHTSPLSIPDHRARSDRVPERSHGLGRRVGSSLHPGSFRRTPLGTHHIGALVCSSAWRRQSVPRRVEPSRSRTI